MGTDRFVFPTLQNQRNYEHRFFSLLDIQTLIIFLNIHGVLFSCCTLNQSYKVHWISLIFSVHKLNTYLEQILVWEQSEFSTNRKIEIRQAQVNY